MTMTRQLVLASTSPYRRELLRRIGLEVEVRAPRFDEEAGKRALARRPAAELVVELARGKAESLADDLPEALIIGADQLALLDGEILSKPGTAEGARAQLERLQGREHQLLTAVCLHDAREGRSEVLLDEHRLLMRRLSHLQIAAYVDRDRPLDCAGSYRIEALGIALFESVSGQDFTAVIGLPLTAVCTLLGRAGVEVLGVP